MCSSDLHALPGPCVPPLFRGVPRIRANVACAVGLRPSAPMEDPMSKGKTEPLSVRVIPNPTGNPPGKLADAEVIFEAEAGPLSGLKLIGFGAPRRR